MSEPIKHVDAFDTEVSIGDTIAFCYTMWQGYTRMVKGTVIGLAPKSFHVEMANRTAPVTILKVKAVKL